MGQTNKKLQAAKDACDDEFYTPMWLAKDLIDPFIPQLKGKKIICPCDSPKSNIYIYLKELGMDVDYSTEMFAVKYRNYDVIITNPPFSKMRSFMRLGGGKKFLIVAFWMSITYSWIIKQYTGLSYLPKGSVKYINNDKEVNTIFITNMDKPDSGNIESKVQDGIVYSMHALTLTNRTDFAKVILFKPDGRESFTQLVYGKNNDGIMRNVKNICCIEGNNYSKEYAPVEAGNGLYDDEQLKLF